MATEVLETPNTTKAGALFEDAIATLRRVAVLTRYDNFISGKWLTPLHGKYFADHSPINAA